MKRQNPINGKTRLTDADVINIQKMAKAGMNVIDISHITGWSQSVVYKIANGSYYRLKAKSRELSRLKSQLNNVNAAKIDLEPDLPDLPDLEDVNADVQQAADAGSSQRLPGLVNPAKEREPIALRNRQKARSYLR